MSIEKFSGQFKNHSRGCTVVLTKTVQEIKDFDVLGLYVYLCSKPESWSPNALELMNQTGYGKNKIYRLINALLNLGLMTVRKIRKAGKFVEFEYTVHLFPVSPVLQKPEVDKPEVENEETYIKEKLPLEKKEKDINNIENPKADAFSDSDTLRKYEIKTPKALTTVHKKYIQKAKDMLSGENLSLDEYLDYLTTRCPRALLPYNANGVERQNGFGNILRPSFIKTVLNGNWED